MDVSPWERKMRYTEENETKNSFKSQPVTVSILSNGREVPAFGLHGGEAGLRGSNRLIRVDGRSETLAACDQEELEAGDQIEICTPGGGGFGQR